MASSDTPPLAPGPLHGVRKVAIPRLQRPGHVSNNKERRRVPRACTACRSHKVKCTGETPRCKHCVTSGRECVYILPRRDRLKNVTEHCIQMAALLNDLKAHASEDDVARIADLLDSVEEDVTEVRLRPAASNPDTDVEDNMNNTEIFDLLDEDLLRDEQARATGFVGKTSEVQWLRSVMLQLERRTSDSGIQFTERPGSSASVIGSVDQVSSFSFYMDSEPIDLDFYGDVYELPSRDVAERLLSCYETTLHTSYPILPKKALDGFRQYFVAMSNGQTSRLNPRWQAILNLVFALGAKYSHLVQATWKADKRDHLIYYAKVRLLGMADISLTSHPDVPQIQMAGLLAFYYLSIGQISRSSIIIGVALRFAYALGLHVRNEDPSASPTKKEMLVRIWWSLYTLDRLLSIVTGRPSTIVDTCWSVPLPLPVAEEQFSDDAEEMGQFRRKQSFPSTSNPISPTYPYSKDESSRTSTQSIGKADANPGSYFRVVIELSILTQDVLKSLYATGGMRSGTDIQQEIRRHGQLLDRWILTLPFEFNFQDHNITQQSYLRERMLLGFHFYSTRILVTRLCFGGLGPNIPESFIHGMANACIESAQAITDFLPNQPNTSTLYASGPWWSIVHSLMQAVSVFLLALTSSIAISHDPAVLSIQVKKIIHCLLSMPDPFAGRAARMALHIFQAVASHLSIDISDLLRYQVESSELSMDHPTWMGGDALTVELGGQLHTEFMDGAGRAGSGLLPLDPGLEPFSTSSRDGQSYKNPF